MENLKKIIRQNIDVSLPYFEMYEKFLIAWDENKELEEALKEVTVAQIEEEFMEIYEYYYLPDQIPKEKETTFGSFQRYTIHKLVHALNTKGEHLIFNATTGVLLSKSSMMKFLKHYSLDDITRVRLYCMFHNHIRPDDDFVSNLNKLNIKWKPIEIKNKKRIHARFPEISF